MLDGFAPPTSRQGRALYLLSYSIHPLLRGMASVSGGLSSRQIRVAGDFGTCRRAGRYPSFLRVPREESNLRLRAWAPALPSELRGGSRGDIRRAYLGRSGLPSCLHRSSTCSCYQLASHQPSADDAGRSASTSGGRHGRIRPSSAASFASRLLTQRRQLGPPEGGSCRTCVQATKHFRRGESGARTCAFSGHPLSLCQLGYLPGGRDAGNLPRNSVPAFVHRCHHLRRYRSGPLLMA